MASRHRKLVVRAEPSCLDLGILLKPVVAILPRLLHFAITFHDGRVCFYMQNTVLVSHSNLERLNQLFATHMDVTGISPYSIIEGELKEEWRKNRKRGSSTGATTDDACTVLVNPLGQESLQHITREYVEDLLKQTLDVGVFFKFGLKLYSLPQNVNFRTRKYRSDVRVRSKDKWITVDKDEAYDEILLLLVEKTQEAVEMYRDSVPEFEMNHFNMFAPVVLEGKDSPVPERKKLYEKRRNKGLDTIAVSVNAGLSQMGRWKGKRVTLR